MNQPPEDQYKYSTLLTWLMGALIVATLLFLSTREALLQESYKKEDTSLCLGFIDPSCSCSHGACWETSKGEVTQLDTNKFLHNPTGQTMGRMGWSKNGKEMLCAFDPDNWQSTFHNNSGNYIGKGNKISCYYPVPDKNMF